MDQDSNRNRRDNARQLFKLPPNKPPIKILLYTDAPESVTESEMGPFGLGRMIEHLKGHSPAFGRFEPKFESRYLNRSGSANNKLDDLLKREAATGEPFDQIWFFGVHQINKKNPNLDQGGGTPDSELKIEELNELQKWMDERQGGVLITGDHANKRPPDAMLEDPDPNNPDPARTELYLSLGRALGRSVPRAGLLRDWEGEPTALPGSRSNTHATIRGVSTTDGALQNDPLPQQINHQLFDEIGRPAPSGQTHPLFFYRDDRVIQFLPDHMHEGSVRLPDVLKEEIWPRNEEKFQPIPHIIATGIDADRQTTLKLLAAYDGTAVDRGRIVADSSWHHYFNINLEDLGFPGELDSPADQIGQFYGNLGIWLCPPEKRQRMADLMIEWLARHPVILEEFGPIETEELPALLATGGTALRVLKRVASPCEIHELIQMTLSKERQRRFETLHLPEMAEGLTPLPSKELVLGYLVNRFPQESSDSQKSAITAELTEAVHTESNNVSELAFMRHRDEVTLALSVAE